MSFKLSEESSLLIDKLTKNLKLPNRAAILKLAFAKGLKEISTPLPPQGDAKGREIPIDVVENSLFDALIRQKYQLTSLGKEKKRYYKIIIDFGAKCLQEEDEYEIESLLLKLAKESNPLSLRYGSKKKNQNQKSNKGSYEKIYLELGNDDKNELVTEIWNDKDHTGQHIGIAGKTGAGKTQFALEILCQMYERTQGNLNIIFFDYAKGDVAANAVFTNFINAEIIDITSDGVPFNPFDIGEATDQKIDELKDIFTSVQKTIGPKQSLELFDILKESYQLTRIPDLAFVYSNIVNTYEAKGKSKDVLVELFHKLEVPKMFPYAGKEGLYKSLHNRSIVFDLHNLDSHMKVKELIAFLILNKIYTEAIRLPDSTINQNRNTREIRTIVVIDEAHNYLTCKNKILERMLRELRSKGVAVLLLTQGFNDFDQKEFDYSTMLNWIFLMKSDNSKQDVEKALALSRDKVSELVPKISLAETGEVFTRKMYDNHKNYTHFNARLFWERAK